MAAPRIKGIWVDRNSTHSKVIAILTIVALTRVNLFSPGRTRKRANGLFLVGL